MGVYFKRLHFQKPSSPLPLQELTGYRVQNGLGCYILSTSWGIMTDKEALMKRTGGEVLISIY